MYLHNKEKTITNEQLYKILKLYSDKDIVNNLFIFDSLVDMTKDVIMKVFNKESEYFINKIIGDSICESVCRIINEGIEEVDEESYRAYCYPSQKEINCVIINTFRVEKLLYDKQLYSIGILIENLYKIQNINKPLKECNKFAIDFVNNHLDEIKEIMNWEEEYEIVDF